MAECIVLKGGSGADLDVVTAGAPDILAGKVGVNNEGEPVVGAMPDCRKPTKIRFWRYNNNRLEVAVDPGLHGCSWADNYYEYLELGDVGIEPWKFRADTTIGGVKGGIPIQGADASNNYAWNTTWANWGDGNIFMGVRDGHLLSGVGWIRAYINNFWASNIKKGVNIGGVVGTFEGYVPTPTDLYLRGNNIAGWTKGGKGNGPDYTISFDAGQITVGVMAADGYLTTHNPINLTGYNGVAVEGYCPRLATNISIEIATINGDYSQYGRLARADTAVGASSYFTAYCDVSAINADRYIHIGAINVNFYVYRIWLY